MDWVFYQINFSLKLFLNAHCIRCGSSFLMSDLYYSKLILQGVDFVFILLVF